MRINFNFPRGKDLGFRIFVVLFLIMSVFLIKVGDFVHGASGDVTLTSSAFSDPDAEDTFNASEWVVRNSGTTVYDQTLGGVNSVTIPAGTFSNGVTYFWKVRYQDQHLLWSDYSAESSFVYGGGTPDPSVVPSGTSSVSSSSTPTPGASSTISATSTAIVSLTPTPNPSPSPAPTATCVFGWALWNGNWVCGDPQSFSTSVLVPEDQNDFCAEDLVKVTYYYHYGQVINGTLGAKTLQDYIDLAKKTNSSGELDSPVHDIYLSTDGGSVYKLIDHDFDPMSGAVMEKIPTSHKNRDYPFAGEIDYLKVTHYVKIPKDTISDPSKAKLLIYVANNRHPVNYGALPAGTMYIDNGGVNLGDSFLFDSNNKSYWDASSGDVMDFANGVQAKVCAAVSPTSSVTPTSDAMCKSTITGPSQWSSTQTNRIAWATGFETPPDQNQTINILLSSGTSTANPLAVMQKDTGSYEAKYDSGSAKSVDLKLEQYVSGKLASSCSVNLKVSSGAGTCTGNNCLPRTLQTVFVLGSLIATLLSLLLTGLSAFPAASRVLSGIFNLLSSPIWGAGWPAGKHAWGIVYDTSNKTPIEKALIRVFSEPGGRLRSTIRTNKNGQFGFVLPAGVYSIAVSHSGYDFPTRLVATSTDGPYANLYRGGNFKAEGDGTEKAQINFNVPLDRVKVSSFDLVELKVLSTVSRFFQAIRMPLMILGTLSTAYLVFTQARTLDYVLAAIYVALWAWEIRNMLKKRAYGLVRDQQGNPVSLVMIRVLDRFNKLRTTIVTGDDGKFQTNLDPGEYKFDISRPGYKSIRTQMIKISNVSDLGRLDLNLTKL